MGVFVSNQMLAECLTLFDVCIGIWQSTYLKYNLYSTTKHI